MTFIKKIFLLIELLFLSLNIKAQSISKLDSVFVSCGISRLEISKKPTDDFPSINFSATKNKIRLSYFKHNVSLNDFEKIGSIIRLNYTNQIIVSSQRTTESYGTLYAFVIKNKNGPTYLDRYTLKIIDNKKILISLSGLLSQTKTGVSKYACILDKIGE